MVPTLWMEYIHTVIELDVDAVQDTADHMHHATCNIAGPAAAR
jgi:hypothetical protein